MKPLLLIAAMLATTGCADLFGHLSEYSVTGDSAEEVIRKEGKPTAPTYTVSGCPDEFVWQWSWDGGETIAKRMWMRWEWKATGSNWFLVRADYDYRELMRGMETR